MTKSFSLDEIFLLFVKRVFILETGEEHIRFILIFQYTGFSDEKEILEILRRRFYCGTVGLPF